MDQFFIVDCLALPDPIEDASILTDLPEARVAKCLRYRREEDRKRSLAAGIVMHKLIGKKDQEIVLGEHGKPEVEGIFFSVSHAGRYALGVQADRPIGCDIEPLRAPRYKVAEHFFSKRQQVYMNSFEEPFREEIFWRLWTLSESYIKMTGEGLSRSLRSFEVTLSFGGNSETKAKRALLGSDPKSAIVTRDGKIQDCNFMSTIYDGYVISVCKKQTE